MLILITMHVHTGTCYVAIANKGACTHSKLDNEDDDEMNTLAFINFYSSKFSQSSFPPSKFCTIRYVAIVVAGMNR